MKHTRTILIKISFIALMLFSFASCKCPVESENVVIEPKAKAYINIINAVSYGSTYKVEAWNRTLIEKLEYKPEINDYVSIGAGECDLSFTPEDDSLYAVKYPITPVQGDAYTLFLGGYKVPSHQIFINDKIENYNPDKAYIRFVNAYFDYSQSEYEVEIRDVLTDKIEFGEYTRFAEVSITDQYLILSHPSWYGSFSLTPKPGKLYTILMLGNGIREYDDLDVIITDKK